MACGGCAQRRDQIREAGRAIRSGNTRLAAERAGQVARSLKRDAMATARNAQRRLDSYTVPGEGAKLDRYGNMRGAEIVQILSAMGALGDQSRTPASKRRAGKKARNYFRRGNKLYERKADGSIIPIMVLASDPTYKPLLEWQDKTAAITRSKFVPYFERRWEQAVKTAKAK
jgi:hypothetical protein